MSRREWLRLGGLGGLVALDLCRVRSARANHGTALTAPGFGRAKSVVVLFAGGGQSQIDTWDPKPDAPAEIRGEFGSIATRVPGVRFCEHLPLTAQVADRLTLARSIAACNSAVSLSTRPSMVIPGMCEPTSPVPLVVRMFSQNDEISY